MYTLQVLSRPGPDERERALGLLELYRSSKYRFQSTVTIPTLSRNIEILDPL